MRFPIKKALLVGRGPSNNEDERAKLNLDDYDLIVCVRNCQGLPEDKVDLIINSDYNNLVYVDGEAVVDESSGRPHPTIPTVFLYRSFQQKVKGRDVGYNLFHYVAQIPVNFSGTNGIYYLADAYAIESLHLVGFDFSADYLSGCIHSCSLINIGTFKNVTTYQNAMVESLGFLLRYCHDNGIKKVTSNSQTFDEYLTKARSLQLIEIFH